MDLSHEFLFILSEFLGPQIGCLLIYLSHEFRFLSVPQRFKITQDWATTHQSMLGEISYSNISQGEDHLQQPTTGFPP